MNKRDSKFYLQNLYANMADEFAYAYFFQTTKNETKEP